MAPTESAGLGLFSFMATYFELLFVVVCPGWATREKVRRRAGHAIGARGCPV